jgi:RNA polymerase sigma-70 factor (ECF subfamily)
MYATMDEQSDTFEAQRNYLFGIAYRMLGSAMEAEDIVQEAYLRWEGVDAATVQSPRAFLSRVVTRLCLDQLKSARERREQYYGPWLPEPVLTADPTLMDTPAGHISAVESISTAFLVMLERLSPVERAVFLLREVFDYGYDEIARIIEKDEANCRKIFSRARQHVTAHRPRFNDDQSAHDRLMIQFMTALNSGDLAGLERVLAEDAVAYADGGGKIQAATRPIHGRDAVAKFAAGIARLSPPDLTTEVMQINGRSGMLVREADGHIAVIILLITDGARINELHYIRNPDKLRHLG